MTLMREIRSGADRIKKDIVSPNHAGVIMPTKPLKQCTYSGCSNLTYGGKCEIHKQAWVNRTQVKRMTGRKLQEFNSIFLRNNPICAVCKTNASVQVDHIIPLAEGGLDTYDNKQAICLQCHTSKTKKESERGRKKVGVG